METKHTAGPWRWSDRFQTSDGRPTFSLLGADGFGILSCDGEANSPQNVNSVDAHLIAAAPELLEALKSLVQLEADGKHADECAIEAWERAAATASKAEGR